MPRIARAVVPGVAHHITQRGNNLQGVCFTDDAWPWGGGHTTDRIVQHVWGLRYIDDLVLTRQDYDLNGDYASNRSDYTHYALSDHQFSVVAMIDDAGKLLERVDYSPNGVARHQFYNDIDGDGDVDANDNSLASNASGSTIGQSNYNVDADFDRDGDVDSNDTVLAGSTYYKSALPAGWISAAGNGGNAFGYCGYRFNQETGLYLVRLRNFDPINGRWLERDPAGYMDSMSLYGYGSGNPSNGTDGTGTGWEDNPGWKDGRHGTYHHYYEEESHGFWFWGYTTKEYKGSTFMEDGNFTDDTGLSDYQRRVQNGLHSMAASMYDAGDAVVFTAGLALIFLPGPEDVIFLLAGGVKFARIAGKWYEILKDGRRVELEGEALRAARTAIKREINEAYNALSKEQRELLKRAWDTGIRPEGITDETLQIGKKMMEEHGVVNPDGVDKIFQSRIDNIDKCLNN